MPPAALTSFAQSWLPALMAPPRFLNTPLVSPMIPRVIVLSVTPLSVLTPPAPVAPAPVPAVLPQAASTRPAASAPASPPARLPGRQALAGPLAAAGGA